MKQAVVKNTRSSLGSKSNKPFPHKKGFRKILDLRSDTAYLTHTIKVHKNRPVSQNPLERLSDLAFCSKKRFWRTKVDLQPCILRLKQIYLKVVALQLSRTLCCICSSVWDVHASELKTKTQLAHHAQQPAASTKARGKTRVTHTASSCNGRTIKVKKTPVLTNG